MLHLLIKSALIGGLILCRMKEKKHSLFQQETCRFNSIPWCFVQTRSSWNEYMDGHVVHLFFLPVFHDLFVFLRLYCWVPMRIGFVHVFECSLQWLTTHQLWRLLIKLPMPFIYDWRCFQNFSRLAIVWVITYLLVFFWVSLAGSYSRGGWSDTDPWRRPTWQWWCWYKLQHDR